MRLDRPRLDPVPQDEIPDEIRDLFGSGRIDNIFSTLAHYPKLLKRWLVFGTHVLNKSSLSARDRELVILRIGYLCRAGYEWGQHVRIAQELGISRDEIAQIAVGPDAPQWSAREAALLRAVDELHSDAFVSDATWDELADLSDQQRLDLLFAVGQYNLVSMVLNTLGVQLDEGLEGLPSA